LTSIASDSSVIERYPIIWATCLSTKEVTTFVSTITAFVNYQIGNKRANHMTIVPNRKATLLFSLVASLAEFDHQRILINLLVKPWLKFIEYMHLRTNDTFAQITVNQLTRHAQLLSSVLYRCDPWFSRFSLLYQWWLFLRVRIPFLGYIRG